MSEITLILGGARSGKSAYALRLAKKYKKAAFIATCEPLDKEMRKRILKHKQARPKRYKTFEEPKNLTTLLGKMHAGFDCIIVDCLTLLISNLVLAGYKEKEILKKIRMMLVTLKNKKTKIIMVSNEVGLGLVPANKLGRDFRDTAGKVNQIAAETADEVFFMVSGIPLKIKPR